MAQLQSTSVTGSLNTTTTITARSATTAASLGGFSVMGAGEFMTTGPLAGYFFENRSGGTVTSTSNWYGWYATSGIVRLYNGSTDIISINGSTGAITMSGTQQIRLAGFAGIEYFNGTAQWQGYIGTENNTGNLRYNSFNGTHTWYSNSSQTMQLGSGGSLFLVGDTIQLSNGSFRWRHAGDWVYAGNSTGDYGGSMGVAAQKYWSQGDYYFGTRGVWLSAYLNQAVLTTSTPTFSGITLNGSIVNNNDGAVIIESNASENNNWLWKEAVKQWGIFYFNRGSQSGQTIGGYTTIGAETFYMGGSSGIDMPSGWTGSQSGSKIAAMISHFNGYIYSASTIFAATSMIVGGNTVWHAGNLTNLNQLTNGPGYITSSALSSYLPLTGGTLTGRTNLHIAIGGGGENLFTGLDPTSSANGRAQFVLSSAYSDLVIASSQANGNHGSTLTFATYNPSNSGDYRKFVINQGNWGARAGFLDFGFADAARTNPHTYINATDDVMSLDGYNKRVGVNLMNPSYTLDVAGLVNTPSGYISVGNPWGTSNSAFFPNGITTAGGTNWIYGFTYIGNAPGNGAGHEFYTSGSSYSTGNIEAAGSMRAPIFYDRNDTTYYMDFNSTTSGVLRGNLIFNDFGAGIVGSYSSTRYQGVFSMGNAYKLPIDGTGPGNLYGLAWSHPNAGGVAGNLNTHGLLVIENGTFLAAVSGSIRARDDIRAPIFYDSENTGFYLDPNGTSNLNQLTTNTRARWGMARWWSDRSSITSDQNHWTGTHGWGVDQGNWDNAWKSGFAGWDIWGSGTAHPQGGGYVHAQGIVSGQHYATSDGGTGYGWMMVGAHAATENRYWLRGKWGGSTSGWVEMITSGNIGSQSVNYAAQAGTASNANTVGGFGAGSFFRDLGFEGGGSNANTIAESRSAFTYAVNAPWSGLIAYFGASGYGLQLNSQYQGTGLSFRSRNGDNATWNTWSTIIHSNNIGSQSVNYANSAGSVAWGNVSGKPQEWLNTTNLIAWNAPNNAVPSGFYQHIDSGGGNPVGTWFNYVNVRHSNPGNVHGYQIGMSYYDNELRFRSYQGGGTYQSWAVALSNQNFTSYVNAPNAVGNGNGYYNVQNWLQVNGSHGIFWPGHYSFHIRPNISSTHTQMEIIGSKNSYGGIYDNHSAVNGFMYDSGGNGGVYREANGRWYWYYHLGNNSMGIGSSANSSSYVLYASGNIYATGDIVAYSDKRKKTNIVTIENALDTVNKMRGVFYDKIGEEEKGRQLGVIAQEVNEVLPEAVTYAQDVDEYGVKYGNMVGLLLEAIKEQQVQIEDLKKQIEYLVENK